MRRRSKKERPVVVDGLEPRILLNGDFNASFSGGKLKLLGDAGANQIVITPGAAGALIITGAGGTTVNGLAAFTTPGAVTKFSVDGGSGGNDRDFRCHYPRVPGTVGMVLRIRTFPLRPGTPFLLVFTRTPERATDCAAVRPSCR